MRRAADVFDAYDGAARPHSAFVVFVAQRGADHEPAEFIRFFPLWSRTDAKSTKCRGDISRPPHYAIAAAANHLLHLVLFRRCCVHRQGWLAVE